MRYVRPVLITVAVTSVVFTLVGGLVGYQHYMEEAPLVQVRGGYRPLTWQEKFDYFAWEASAEALPFAVLLTLGVAAAALPGVLLVARRRPLAAYMNLALMGAMLAGLMTGLASYFVFGHWPTPRWNLDWIGSLVGGATCGIVLTSLVRRAAPDPRRAQGV